MAVEDSEADQGAEVHQDRGGLAAPVVAHVFEGRVARTHDDGDPLTYPWGNEYRDAAGLKQICDGLQTPRPVVLLHPDGSPENKYGMLRDGATGDVVGLVIGARIDGDHVVARFLVTAPHALDAIKNGIRELSLGYTSKLDDKRRQYDFRIDHLAMVPAARCGATCAFRADAVADGAASASPCACKNHAVLSIMADANVDAQLNASERPPSPVAPASTGQFDKGIMDELKQALADAIAQKTRADALDAELGKVRLAATQAETDLANARADLAAERKLTADANARADQARADADAAIAKAKVDGATASSEAVTARVKLMTEANRVLGDKGVDGKPVDRAAMTDQAIRLAVIKHVDGEDYPADKESLFVEGLYTGALRRADAAAASRGTTRQAIVDVRHVNAERVAADAAEHPSLAAERAAREASNRESANAWQKRN